MSSMGRKDGIEAGEVEPYVIVALWVGFRFCGEADDVCGRVNSSNRSARRGWCMCRCVAEESLLWVWLVGLVYEGGGRRVPFWMWIGASCDLR